MASSQKMPGSRKALRAQSKKKKRQAGRLVPRKFYLIACEGQEAEPNYFKKLSNQLPRDIIIMAKGEGRNTLSLVQWAEREAEKLKKEQQLDEVWIVMDRDSFPPHDFDNAIRSAESKGFQVAWSNECFELWILLHFRDVMASTARADLYRQLAKFLKIRNYEIDGKSLFLYSLIRQYGGNEEEAIERAAALWNKAEQDESAGTPFHQLNPATGIFKLVQRLNAHRNN